MRTVGSRVEMQVRLATIFFMTLASAAACPAQISAVELRRLLSVQAGFQTSDLDDLDAGRFAVKLIPSSEKREIAIIGVVRFRQTIEPTMAAFRSSLTPAANKAVISDGKFSSPPVIDDLRTLKFESKDIEELRQCKPGDCDLKLSSSMITRARTEVDWDGSDYQNEANKLLSSILIDYTRDYMARGNKALLQIDSRPVPVYAAQESRELIERTPFAKEFVPDLRQYLTEYPSYKLAGVEDQFFWSKINFGIKPIVTVVQSAYYSTQFDNLPQFAMATKQIFATRYLESSLAFSFWINLKNNGETESYLVFTNLSRSDALIGALGGMKRTIAEREAKSRVTEILQQAKLRLERDRSNGENLTSLADGAASRGFEFNMLLSVVAGVSLLGAFIAISIFYYKKTGRIAV